MLVGCSKKKYEKELLGVWNNYPSDGSTEIRFYKDSVMVFEYGNKMIGTWSADESQIKNHFPMFKGVEGFKADYTIDYKLIGDSLFIKNQIDSTLSIPFFKVNNYWIHYLRQFDFEIDLPVSDFKMNKVDSYELGVNLFIGFKNKELIVQYNDENEDVLDKIKAIVYAERSIYEDNEIKYLHFNLIVDKNISEQKIDSIKNILNVFPEMKIFRVYKNDTANYGKYDLENENWYDWNWYGRFE